MSNEDMLEIAERLLRTRSTDALALVQTVEALAAEVRALRKDRERLDWLEGEMDRERQAIAHGMPIPRSLFRQNEPITRPLIDAALSARSGEDGA